MDLSEAAGAALRVVTLRDAGADFAAVAAILGVVALLWKWPLGPMFRWGRRTASRVDLLLTDWAGVEDRDGVPGRPGVMAQLADQRAALAEQSATLAEQHGGLAEVRRQVLRMEKDLLSLRSQVQWLMRFAGKPTESEETTP